MSTAYISTSCPVCHRPVWADEAVIPPSIAQDTSRQREERLDQRNAVHPACLRAHESEVTGEMLLGLLNSFAESAAGSRDRAKATLREITEAADARQQAAGLPPIPDTAAIPPAFAPYPELPAGHTADELGITDHRPAPAPTLSDGDGGKQLDEWPGSTLAERIGRALRMTALAQNGVGAAHLPTAAHRKVRNCLADAVARLHQAADIIDECAANSPAVDDAGLYPDEARLTALAQRGFDYGHANADIANDWLADRAFTLLTGEQPPAIQP